MTSFTSETTFDLWLKERRRSLGLTRKELAERIGCSTVTIVKIETGERRPSRQIAELLAVSLGIPQDQVNGFVDFARMGSAGSRPQLPVRDALWHLMRERPNNLPAQMTSFIGREEVLAQACARLRRADVRLLTLTGPPGIGKTRLSLELATEMLADFEDGIFVVALSSIHEPSLVVSAIGQALKIRESGQEPLLDGLIAGLRNKHLLLVLDNFEQVIPAGTAVSELLRSCHHLKIVATSREALHLYGEHDLPVPHMTVPAEAGHYDVGSLLRYEAVQLFAERASAVDSSFALSEQSAPLVAQLCMRLDGLPLAIELAAGRVRELSLEGVAERIGDRLALLEQGPLDLPNRQRTLKGAVAWSYDLLNEDEQRLFRHLSVFVAGCTSEAVEEVAPNFRAGDTQRLMRTLADKNLLRREAGTEASYWMLETIREYAWEQLQQSGESDLLRERFTQYYMHFAERAEAELQGPGQLEWLSRLDREYANLRAALIWGESNASLREPGLRLAAALGKFWESRGFISEGRGLLSAVLSNTDMNRVDPVIAKALSVAGRLALYPGDFEAARAYFERSLAISRALVNQPGISNALNNLGVVTQALGQNEVARAAFTEALAIRRDLGDKAGIANSLNSLATLATTMGDYSSAVTMAQEGLQIRREIGHEHGIMLSLASLADARMLEGNPDAAGALLEEYLRMSQEAGNKPGIAKALHNLGHVAYRRRDWESAKRFYIESLNIYIRSGEKPGIAECMAGLAEVAALRGHPERAVRLFGAVDTILQSTGFHLSLLDAIDYEQGMAAARSQLDEQAWTPVWESGKAMRWEDAVAFALDGTDSANA